jgi:hypothetical protein
VRGPLKNHRALSFESYSMVRYFFTLKFLGLPNSRVLPLKIRQPGKLGAPDLILWSGPRSITEPLLQASVSLNLGTVPQPVHHVCCDSPNCFLGPSPVYSAKPNSVPLSPPTRRVFSGFALACLEFSQTLHHKDS